MFRPHDRDCFAIARNDKYHRDRDCFAVARNDTPIVVRASRRHKPILSSRGARRRGDLVLPRLLRYRSQ